MVCSDAAFRESDWVRWEIERAIEKEKRQKSRVLYPIVIDDALFEESDPQVTRIRQVLAADFRQAMEGDAFHVAVERLVKSLHAPGSK